MKSWQNEPLLAKGYDRRRHSTPPFHARLDFHSRQVVEAAEAIFQKIGSSMLQQADLNSEFDRMLISLRIFGWLHDLGKSHSQWAEMIRSPQHATKLMLRHEVVSGLLLTQPECSEWFDQLPENVRLPALLAILGHHRKMPKSPQPEQVRDLIIPLTHPDLQFIFAEASKQLGIWPPSAWSTDLVLTLDEPENSEDPARRNVYEALDIAKSSYRRELRDERERRFVGLLKGVAIAADVTASALGPVFPHSEGSSIRQWIASDRYLPGMMAEDFDHLLERYMGTREFRLRPFQQTVADLAEANHSLILIEAGCGSGKSVAAYCWAQAWCRKIGRRTLFFALPTTGTASEHFRDYALFSGIESTLMHSRAEVDLERITESIEEQQESAAEPDDPLEPLLKSEGLRLCTTPLIVCTTDTVLGLMANARLSLFSFPAIMNGLLVFDEIHAYDDILFGHLLVFLKYFPKLPVLLMTASLPPLRRQLLQYVRPDLKIVSGPPELEQLRRYQLVPDVVEAEADERIFEILRQGGKVLYVCNQVERANNVYRTYKKRLCFTDVEVQVDVYHSRFRYIDRCEVHRKVIDRFKTSDKPYLLVTTQVAEMSLDLSADLLITELAPIAALIQRLGRLNRHLKPSQPVLPKQALVLKTDLEDAREAAPYSLEQLRTAKQWIQHLSDLGRPISQADLRQAVKDMDIEDLAPQQWIFNAEQNASFFTSGWWTEQSYLRQGGYTIPVVMERDLLSYKEKQGNIEPKKEWVRAHEVPMTVEANWLKQMRKWSRCRGIPVAPEEAISYDFDEITKGGTGAKWKKASNTD